MESWIKLYDKMLEWQWYKDIIVKAVFLHCLLRANFADEKWQNIVIKRGQFKTTIAQLADELNLSSKQIRNALEKLKKTNEIEVIGANKYSLITICKYDDYQQKTDDLTDVKANKGQTKGKQSPTISDNINNNIISDHTDNKNNINPNGYNIAKSQPETDLFGEVIPQKKRRKSAPDTDFREVLIEVYKVEEQHLKDWMVARKKKPITDTVLQYLIRESAKAGISVAEAIRVSAEHSWQGFKAEWYKNLTDNENGFHNRQRQDRRGESPAPDWNRITPEQMEF